MAGGTFTPGVEKTRPGNYIRVVSIRQDLESSGERGIVLIPLIDHPYGPAKEFITISSTAPDAQKAKLGYSIYDKELLLVREAMKNCPEVVVYIPREGTKAKATEGELTATAMHGGSRGNALSYSVSANPVSGFDVTIYLDTDIVEEFEEIEKADAVPSEWLKLEGTLAEHAGIKLTGGVDGNAVNSDITGFLDASENIEWTTLAFPVDVKDNASLMEALASKIKYLRDDVGKYCKAVVANYAGGHISIINVTNGVVLTDGTKIDPVKATAWVAGADAGASATTSLTERAYQGAIDLIGGKSHEESVAAIKKGEFFFKVSEGEIVVEYDINSLVNISEDQDKSYKKNRVIRTIDSFCVAIRKNLPPNKFNNDPTGWDVQEGIGRAVLQQFLDAGAITNVDLENDFKVDRTMSSGDATYFIVCIQPVDSSEKLYFRISTR